MIAKIANIEVDKKDPNMRRTRKMLGDLSSLVESIKKHGLLHPIIVEEIEGGWRLIAGERRLRACILNSQSEIEVRLMSNLDNITSKEIELEENIVRKNLDWMEECEALRQLDELKALKYGRAHRGSHIGFGKDAKFIASEGWKMGDTADAVGISISAVSQDIKLANDLRAHPALVEKVKRMPKSAARKVIRQALEAEELRGQVDRQEIAIHNNLLLGDACELIDKFEDESIHMLLTDPPFGISDIVNVGSIGTMTYNKLTPSNVSDEDTMRDVYKRLWPKVFKKLTPGAHIYVFLGMGWYCNLISMLREVGFIVDDLPLIWPKGRPSMIAKDIHYVSSYEAILFGYKPPLTRILKKPISNVIAIPTIAPQKRIHSLQKPFDLLKIFIENSSHVGEIVLDCFAGSASTLVAAEKLERSSIGFEIDEGNYLRAQAFMKGELKNGDND